MFDQDGTHAWIGMMLIGLSTITTMQVIYSLYQWIF